MKEYFMSTELYFKVYHLHWSILASSLVRHLRPRLIIKTHTIRNSPRKTEANKHAARRQVSICSKDSDTSLRKNHGQYVMIESINKKLISAVFVSLARIQSKQSRSVNLFYYDFPLLIKKYIYERNSAFTCESLSLLTDGSEFESELSPSAS